MFKYIFIFVYLLLQYFVFAFGKKYNTVYSTKTTIHKITRKAQMHKSTLYFSFKTNIGSYFNILCFLTPPLCQDFLDYYEFDQFKSFIVSTINLSII